MSFVLCDRARWKVKNPAECVPDSIGHGIVTCCSIPDRQYVLLKNIVKSENVVFGRSRHLNSSRVFRSQYISNQNTEGSEWLTSE